MNVGEKLKKLFKKTNKLHLCRIVFSNVFYVDDYPWSDNKYHMDTAIFPNRPATSIRREKCAMEEILRQIASPKTRRLQTLCKKNFQEILKRSGLY